MTWLIVLFLAQAAPTAPREGTIALPEPGGLDLSLGAALRARRSVRSFDPERSLTRLQLGNLLWAMSGINRPDPAHPRGGKRTAPSAFGSCAVDAVITFAGGTFLYSPREHVLVPFGSRGSEDLRARVSRTDWIRKAPVVVVLVAHLDRYPERIGPEERRIYSHADAAVMAENHYLACAALGLGTVLTVGSRKEAGAALGLGTDQEVVFVLPVGQESSRVGTAPREGRAPVPAALDPPARGAGETTARGLRFRHHFIDRDLPAAAYGQTSLVDVDRDGDLDFITGGGDSRRHVFWFEHHAAGKWTRHVLGDNHPSDVGGTAFDVDRDGWVDHVSGGAWYRNSGEPRARPFERHVFDAGLGRVHDVVAADLDGDGRLDVTTMSDANNLRWYRIPADPTRPWKRHDIGAGVHAGVAAGDIDGDGDLDVVRSDLWFENAGGRGERWKEHPIPFGNPGGRFPLSTRCVVVDINRDGHRDLVLTDNEIRAGKLAWLENVEGRGERWKVHPLPAGDTAPRGAYHSLAVADFDGDGDPDVFTVEMEHIRGAGGPRWFIWENRDGRGATFVERVILDGGLGGHEAVAADVDGDGDIDIASKLWRPRSDNANGGRNHADYLENLTIEKPRKP